VGPPCDPKLITQLTNTNDPYLSVATREDDEPAKTFQVASDPKNALQFFPEVKIKALIANVQPDVLAARAQAADKTLNNQSLVILFSFAGKHLLFAGDAQWRSWENFLRRRLRDVGSLPK
jgi:beta-lactamase superfamily II metal-dependent hydrolase